MDSPTIHVTTAERSDPDGGPAVPPAQDAAALFARLDATETPLGPAGGWPRCLRTVMELVLRSPVPMTTLWGPEGVMLYNDAYSRLAGDRHPAVFGMKVREAWPEVADFNARVLETCLGGGTLSFRDQPMRLLRDGRPRETFFDLDYSPIPGEGGRPAGVLAVVVETTQRVRAERENAWLLAYSERANQRLHQMFDQAPGFMAVVRGPDHVFEMVNRAYVELVGQRDLIGLTVRQALGEVAGQGYFELLDQVRATGTPFVGRGMRIRMRRGGGAGDDSLEERFLDFVYQPLLEDDGGVSGIFVQGHDVTERHRLLEDLREADRRKDEFLAMLAHELRNPLAPLTNAHRLLERSGTANADERAAMALALAERQTRQLTRLVDDLLEISRISRGKIALRPEAMIAQDAVRDAAESVAPMLEERGQRLDMDLPADPVRLHADPARVAQVLENLLNNASKYSHEGAGIRVRMIDGPGEVEIRVEDEGIGMEPATIPRIFELFTQIDATLDRSRGGLGIGLALVRRLVAMHGGRVGASSPGKGRGSTFWIRLPHEARLSADDGDA